MEKLKVAMICHVSNEEIRSHLLLRQFSLRHELKKMLGKTTGKLYRDYSIWSTLAFKEFESIEDIELHAIIPHPGMKNEREDFMIRGVYYHCFRQEMGAIIPSLLKIKQDALHKYHKNMDRIMEIINSICPDVLNVIGAEGLFYSPIALKISSNKYPIILSLQTAVSDPDFLQYYSMDVKIYSEVCKYEQALFKHCKYIASDCSWHRTIAKRYNENAIFVRHHFCTPHYEIKENETKQYDFAYWAANINKAGDDAIEAFALAYKKDKTLTLNMIGGYSPDYKFHLEQRIRELGIEGSVNFTGYMPTHVAALNEVVKSRYALLPIKIDIISGTIREALMLGLPVVTFITKGTPHLNSERETVLLSEIGDYGNMAINMLRLKSDKILAGKLIRNGKETSRVFTDNTSGMRLLADTYRAVYEHFHYSKKIPDYMRKTTC